MMPGPTRPRPARTVLSEGTPPPARTAVIRPGIYLTATEVFDACQALADADRVLVATGTTAEAGALGDLFELLEDRMTS